MANDPADGLQSIRGMQFPKSFVQLWNAGRWQQPADHLIAEFIPWLQGPIEFIEDMQWLIRENRALVDYQDGPRLFHQYKGSTALDKPDLPYLDVEQSLLIAVNRNPGDDLAIAIDFRSSTTDPRVVATFWDEQADDLHVEWRLVSTTFTLFLDRLGMQPSGEITN